MVVFLCIWEQGDLGVRHGIEGADKSGTQFLAGQVQSDVASGQPDLLSWLVGGSRCATQIGCRLLPVHCPLEVMVCLIPDSLTLPEPIVNGGNVGGFSRPREERGLVTEYALKRCKTRGWSLPIV